jgi:hypothetical protein
MATGTPVVVSRIQNRRGTQQQFDGYPYSIPGPNSVYPLGYNGVGGYNTPEFPDYIEANYPNVLMPGELALCTDTHRLFIGNVNGKFDEVLVGIQDTDLTRLRPQPFTLVPTGTTWTKITNLTTKPIIDPTPPIQATPFLSFLYSASDSAGPNPTPSSVGIAFARNGELQVTSLSATGSALPKITLTDVSTEINTTAFDISFKADYNIDGTISLWYIHNFPVSLTLGFNAITWLPLI